MAAAPTQQGQGQGLPPAQPARWLQASEINRALHEYRRGRLSRKELVKVMEVHRDEFFRDDPRDGNLVHALIRRGHTKSLLQVILPNHPDVVLATERVTRNEAASTRPPRATVTGSSSSSSTTTLSASSLGVGGGLALHPAAAAEAAEEEEGGMVTLLRRAVERKDRAVVDGIVRGIKVVLDRSVERADPPERREVLLATLLRIEDWRLALLEYPSLLDDPAVRGLFELHPSTPGVIAAVDEGDFRANLAHGELRSLGAEGAFPENFWAENIRRRKPTLFSREGLRLLYSPRGRHDGGLTRHPTTASFAFSPTGQPLLHRAVTTASIDGHDKFGETATHVYHEITETSGVEVEASLVGFPNALRAGDDHSLLRLCCDLYERTGKPWLFELETVAIILKYKWNAFGRPIYKLLLGLSLLLAANYSLASAYCLPLLQSPVQWQRRLGLAWQGLLFVNAFPLIVQEYWQWHLQGTRAYFKKGANVLDALTLLLLHASATLRFVPSLMEDQGLRSLYHLLSSLSALLLWFKLMVYLRGFHETGPLIRMIWQIVIDTRFFLVVLAISVVGFGNCLYLIFQEDIEREDAAGAESPIRTSYGTLFHTFLVLFAALNSNLDYNPFNASRFRVLASLVYILACIFNTIILLNLLIALMGDSYDRVQENAVAQGRFEQALSVLEIEAMLPRRILQDPRFFPRWIQILRPKLSPGDAALAADAETQQWSGRLRQIYKKIEASERRIAHEIDGVGTQLELMERRVLGLPIVSPAGNGNGPTADAGIATPASTAAATTGATAPLSTDGAGSGSGASSPMPPHLGAATLGSNPNLVQLAATATTAAAHSGGGNGSRTPPSPSGSLAAAASARALGTRLSRLEESVVAIDGKVDRLLRLVAAMALSDNNDRATAAASLLLLPPSPAPAEDGRGDEEEDEEGSDGSVNGRR